MSDTVDSNVTGLAFAEESTLKTLPGSPKFYGLEPNSYDDFGGNYSLTARNPINANRRRKKGVITDLDASGGFETDLTKSNLARIMQGFMFADAHEKTTTDPISGGAAVPITSVAGSTDDHYGAASGLGSFAVGALVYAEGFGIAGNNGLKIVDSGGSATVLPVTTDLTAEASPPAAAKVTTVGFEFGSGDLVADYTAGVLTLTTTTANLNDKGLSVGEWIYIGGDTSGTSFATLPKGFARISAIAAKVLTFDKTTFTPASDSGTGKTVRVFFGTFLRDEDAADIVRRTYTLQRTLGDDGDGIQSEYLKGAVANEFSLDLSTADKAMYSMSFAACEHTTRTGAEGPLSDTGSLTEPPTEDAFNTSNDVVRAHLTIIDPANPNPSALFGFAEEIAITINNNVTPNKAIGTLGAFEMTAGTFEVGGSLTAYFSTVTAAAAIRNNSDVALDVIFAKDNAGVVFDLPLIALGNGRLNVVQDEPIKLPLDMPAAESSLGFTLGVTQFPYLPTAAMPS